VALGMGCGIARRVAPLWIVAGWSLWRRVVNKLDPMIVCCWALVVM
jgi:hypothetical protein